MCTCNRCSTVLTRPKFCMRADYRNSKSVTLHYLLKKIDLEVLPHLKIWSFFVELWENSRNDRSPLEKYLTSKEGQLFPICHAIGHRPLAADKPRIERPGTWKGMKILVYLVYLATKSILMRRNVVLFCYDLKAFLCVGMSSYFVMIIGDKANQARQSVFIKLV